MSPEGRSLADAQDDEQLQEVVAYTEEDLSEMTIAQIKALADELGITVSGTKKADIIASFIAAQESA